MGGENKGPSRSEDFEVRRTWNEDRKESRKRNQDLVAMSEDLKRIQHSSHESTGEMKENFKDGLAKNNVAETILEVKKTTMKRNCDVASGKTPRPGIEQGRRASAQVISWFYSNDTVGKTSSMTGTQCPLCLWRTVGRMRSTTWPESGCHV